ncbi:MAG: phospholipid carrier-dependent glycosyltransferase [Candidatus Thiodiazotropha sp. (ex Troendleina suluensis)]|nr:phospholipid carrier-dependent glycosyltransferase [Candidatus Thiodiazotropha sp. (ex Troendleina suluensis)]
MSDSTLSDMTIDTSLGFWLKISIIVTALFCYLLVSLTYPLEGHADTNVHLDYAWQISEDLQPAFLQGIKLPLIKNNRDIQFAAHHPPLYYKLLSPVVGYFVDNDYKLKQVVLSARLFNIVIAISLSVLILIYARYFNILKLPNFDIYFLILFIFYLPFIKVSSLLFNEVLLVFFIFLSWVYSIRVLMYGYDVRAFIILLISVTLGFYTKVSFLPTLLIAATLLYIGMIKSSTVEGGLFPTLKLPTVHLLVILISALAVSGSFYYGNYEQSGTFYRAADQSWAAIYDSREYKDLYRVITDSHLWWYLFSASFDPGLKYIFNHLASPLTTLINIIAFISFFSYIAIQTIKGKIDYKQAVVIVAFVLTIAAVFMQMIVHAIGYGSINPRYLLPAIIAIITILSSGLLLLGKPSKYIIILYFILSNLAVLGFIRFSNQALVQGLEWYQIDHLLKIISKQQGLPYWLYTSVATGWVISTIITLVFLISFFKLSSKFSSNEIRSITLWQHISKNNQLRFNNMFNNKTPSTNQHSVNVTIVSLIIIVVLFTTYSYYLANDLRLGIPPDEIAHLSKISHMNQNWGVFKPLQEQLCTHGGKQRYDPNYLSHPPLYYLLSAVFTDKNDCTVVSDYYSLRMLSITFSVLALCLFIFGVQKLNRDNSAVILYALFITSIPIFPYISAAVNNDSLAILSFSILLFGWFHLYANSKSNISSIIIAFGLALCLLTKATAGLQAIIFSLTLLVITPSNLRKSLLTPNRYMLYYSAILLVPLIYFIYTKLAFSSFLPSGTSLLDSYWEKSNSSMTLSSYFNHYSQALFKSFTGITSHASIYKQNAFQSYGIILMVLISISQIFRKPKDKNMQYLWIIFIAGVFTTLIFTVTHFSIVYTKYLHYGYPGGVQFRYFFPLIPVIAIGYILWHTHTNRINKFLAAALIAPSLFWGNIFFYFDNSDKHVTPQHEHISATPVEGTHIEYKNGEIMIAGPLVTCEENGSPILITYYNNDIYSADSMLLSSNDFKLIYQTPFTCKQYQQEINSIKLIQFCAINEKYDLALNNLTSCQ